jgi:hypothetical protein
VADIELDDEPSGHMEVVRAFARRCARTMHRDDRRGKDGLHSLEMANAILMAGLNAKKSIFRSTAKNTTRC